MFLIYSIWFIRFLSTESFVSSALMSHDDPQKKQKCEFVSHVANSLSALSSTSDQQGRGLVVLREKRDIDFLPFEKEQSAPGWSGGARDLSTSFILVF